MLRRPPLMLCGWCFTVGCAVWSCVRCVRWPVCAVVHRTAVRHCEPRHCHLAMVAHGRMRARPLARHGASLARWFAHECACTSRSAGSAACSAAIRHGSASPGQAKGRPPHLSCETAAPGVCLCPCGVLCAYPRPAHEYVGRGVAGSPGASGGSVHAGDAAQPVGVGSGGPGSWPCAPMSASTPYRTAHTAIHRAQRMRSRKRHIPNRSAICSGRIMRSIVLCASRARRNALRPH